MKYTKWLILFVATFLLSGCIKMDITEIVDGEGDVSTKITMDSSAAQEMVEEMPEGTENNTPSICDTSSFPEGFTVDSCEQESPVVAVVQGRRTWDQKNIEKRGGVPKISFK